VTEQTFNEDDITQVAAQWFAQDPAGWREDGKDGPDDLRKDVRQVLRCAVETGVVVPVKTSVSKQAVREPVSEPRDFPWPDGIVESLAEALYADAMKGAGLDNSGYPPFPWAHYAKYAHGGGESYRAAARAALAALGPVLAEAFVPRAELDEARRWAARVESSGDSVAAAYTDLAEAHEKLRADVRSVVEKLEGFPWLADVSARLVAADLRTAVDGPPDA